MTSTMTHVGFTMQDYVQDPKDKNRYLLTIYDPEGYVYVCIEHNCESTDEPFMASDDSSIDGPLAEEKRERARAIVHALNGYFEQHYHHEWTTR